MAMKIAILEDNAERQEAMRDCLVDRFPQFEIRLFDNVPEMVAFLELFLADTLVIALDHDLELKPGEDGRLVDPGTGREVADYLAEKEPVCPVVIHTTNADAALGMAEVLREGNWITSRVIPTPDMDWISTQWFSKMRRAIVGPIPRRSPQDRHTRSRS